LACFTPPSTSQKAARTLSQLTALTGPPIVRNTRSRQCKPNGSANPRNGNAAGRHLTGPSKNCWQGGTERMVGYPNLRSPPPRWRRSRPMEPATHIAHVADDNPYEGTVRREVCRVAPAAAPTTESDLLALERPIALEYNGISHATMLATPSDLEDFALGFSFTEGIVRDADDIYDIEIDTQAMGTILRVEIASACLHGLKQRRRNMAGRSGCGLCGVETLGEVQRTLPPVTQLQGGIKAEAIVRALRLLRAGQAMHDHTGATHAAAWAQADGTITTLREDVGRHNALDKLVGRLLTERIDVAQGFIVVSSRASFEMVQKAAAAG